MKKDFLFIPIGGCQEVGLNMNLYHFDGKFIMVDCGVGFPKSADELGVDMIIPDISFLVQNKIKLEALILTHSHEDHIGAVCALWEQLNCTTIYSNEFSTNFLKYRLKEHNIKKKMHIKTMKVSEDGLHKEFSVGPFTINPVFINHSTPQMSGLFIKTKEASVFHTGDWNLDNEVTIDLVTNMEHIAKLSAEYKTCAMMCDSTNVEKLENKNTERDVKVSLKEIAKETKGMLVITTFASNVERIKSVLEVAQETGKMVAIAGMAMKNIIEIAQKSGYIKKHKILSIKECSGMKRSNVILLCSGCQGNENSTMFKLAQGTYKLLKLKDRDCVVFSSKMIPGNEAQIFTMMENLLKNKIKYITEKDDEVHVSGHPCQKDLMEMYKAVNAKYLIPVHGNQILINKHKLFGDEFFKGNTMQPINGSVIQITNDKCINKGFISVKKNYIDGNRIIEGGDNILSERKALVSSGVLVINIFLVKKIFKKNQQMISIKDFGIISKNPKDHESRAIRVDIERICQEMLSQNTNPDSLASLENVISNKISQFMFKRTKKNPIISVKISKEEK